MFKIRRIVEDYESRLTSLDPERAGVGASAKAEHERFASGEERFKVRMRKLAVRDGTSLDVLLKDTRVGTTIVENGAALFVLESSDGRTVPKVRAGDSIVIAHAGVPLLSGVFARD
jgi:hypothetical protein